MDDNKKKFMQSPNVNNSDSLLLPNGFYDLLFDEAKKNHNYINQILEGFFAKNFNLIKTSLLEFEENFSYDQNYFFNPDQCFHSIDSISGKKLILRNDITLQIKRLLTTRLQNIELPLKICYVGDVFCANNEELYGDRQQTQIGCEIIGDKSEESNFDIIETTIEVLKKVGLTKLIINFSLPDFLEIFINQLSLNEIQKQHLTKIILEKNLTEIKIFTPQYFDLIKKIILNNHDFIGLTSIIKKYFSTLEANEAINLELKKISEIYQFIVKNFPEIIPTFSFFTDNSRQYHHSFAFEIFYENFTYPIAIAGRYKIITANKTFDAVGSTIYINHLRKINF
jgi:ATP phosphoribosyltransferase regulatory subunit